MVIYAGGSSKKFCLFFIRRNMVLLQNRFSGGLLPKGNLFVLVSVNKKRLTAGLSLCILGFGPPLKMCIRYSSPFLAFYSCNLISSFPFHCCHWNWKWLQNANHLIHVWEFVFVVFQHLCQISCLESCVRLFNPKPLRNPILQPTGEHPHDLIEAALQRD